MDKDNPLFKTKFRGMMPIMPTVITEEGNLDEAGQRRVMDYCLENGAVAIGHFGYASEFYKICDLHRFRLITQIVTHVNGRVPVFIGVTAPSNRIILDNARQAEALGANLLMVSLPYVNIPDADETLRLFEQLSKAITTPIIIQDTAATSGVLSADLITRIVREIGGIHSIKAEGSNFIDKTVQIKERLGDEVQVIGGSGGRHLIHLLRLGVTAFMTGTEALDIHNSVVQAYLKGNEDEAANIYFNKLLPYFMFYTEHSEELLKEMLHLRGIIDCPAVISPRQSAPMSQTKWREFNWLLDRIGYPRKG